MGTYRVTFPVLGSYLFCLGLFRRQYITYLKLHRPRHTFGSILSVLVPLHASRSVPFTPILRVVVAHVNRETFKYFLGVWFFAVVISPIPSSFGAFHVDSNLLMIPGWIGYFLLGVFLLSVKLRRSTVVGLMALGLILTAVGTYAIAATIGGPKTFFFQDYFSPTTILSAVMLFLLLNTLKPQQTQ